MIVSHPIYGDEVSLRCVVYNAATATWVEVLGDSTQVSLTRGGNVGEAGVTSVEVGSLTINILDVYDPSSVSLLKPNVTIILYIDDPSTFATPRVDGAIFTGNIQDIKTDYFLEGTEQHINIEVYAVDAVSSHTGITVTNLNGEDGFTGTTFNGVANTANGYQRWEDRINDLSTTFAKMEVPTVIISAPVPIYNI